MRVSGQTTSGSVFSNGYVRSQPQSGQDQTQTVTESAPPSGSSLPKAKLVRTNFGFSIGSFGLHYTSEDIEIDGDKIARDILEKRRARKAAAFSEEMDSAGFDVPPPDEDPAVNLSASGASDGQPARPQGGVVQRLVASAYACQQTSGEATVRSLCVV